MPVPPPLFTEYSVIIAEGFCPECLVPLTNTTFVMKGISWGPCPACGCEWEYNTQGWPSIHWRGRLEDGTCWDVWENYLPNFAGTARPGLVPRPCVRKELHAD